MYKFFKTAEFNAQFLRTFGKTYHQGADIGECLALIPKIQEEDKESWYYHWSELAKALTIKGEKSWQAGHKVSASQCFFRASEYYRQAIFFLYSDLSDKRILEAADKIQYFFVQALTLADIPFEPLRIPFESKKLYGYIFFANEEKEKAPTLILPSGYDSFCEELYFAGALGARLRGMHVICLDGPGQGQTLVRERLYMRPDYENVLTPVIDFLTDYPAVDQNRLLAMGRSFGGYLMPRAVTKEKRIKALICDPGIYDCSPLIVKMLTKELVDLLLSNDSGAFNRSFEEFMFQSPMRAIYYQSRMSIHGVKTPFDLCKSILQCSFKDSISQIQCPTLICSNSQDPLASQSRDFYEKLTAPKNFLFFEDDEGGATHCESLAIGTFEQKAFDWRLSTLSEKQ